MRTTSVSLIGLILGASLLGCCISSRNRFIPIEGSGGVFALDSKTGQRCITVTKAEWAGNEQKGDVFCLDLYKLD